jgi:cytochrome c oxidase subunit IV
MTPSDSRPTAGERVRAGAESLPGSADHGDHVVPLTTYLAVFAALMVMLALTVAAAEVDLGFLNTPIALTIAIAKMILVLLYFMHLRYSSRLNWVIVATGFFWLAVMIAGTMDDVISRGWLGYPGG